MTRGGKRGRVKPNSRASKANDAKVTSYVKNGGDPDKLILLQKQKRFATKLYDEEDGRPGHWRGADSERKLFEHASRLSDDGEKHDIYLLSEKEMCDSCKFVMKQFKRRYPSVNVNVVSHKSSLAKKNKKRNPVFEFDVEREFNEIQK